MAVKIKLPFVVRDAIHGNISFSQLEKELIDTPLFQRLRGISQLGFLKYVFPSAGHTRFEHSLGVMHLAGKILRSIVDNQKEVLSGLTGSVPEPLQGCRRYLDALDSPAVLQRLRLAGLLHDLGHGPFSHASEGFTRSIKGIDFLSNPLLSPELKEYYAAELEKGTRIDHEWVTALMVLSVFSGLDNCDPGLPRDVLAILNPQLPLSAESAFEFPEIRFLLHDIISNEMDADRMDYLFRDSHAAGINYGIFDLERLLKNVCFIVEESARVPRMAILFQGLMAFEDYLFRRYQMYLQVYTQKTNCSLEAMLGRIREHIELEYPLDPEKFLDFTDATFPSLLEKVIGTSPRRELLYRLWEHIFKLRNPWKTMFLGNAQAEEEEDPLRFREILDCLAGSPFADDYIPYEDGKALTRYTPQLDWRSPLSLKVIRREPMTDQTEVIDLFRYSYLISAFRKPIRSYRIYVNPEKLEQVKEYLRQRL